MRVLVIRGWDVGLDKIMLTKTLRAEFGYSLTEGKSMTDRILTKEEVRIPLGHRPLDEKDGLLKKLQVIGVRASIES